MADHHRMVAETLAAGLGQVGITGRAVTGIEEACDVAAGGRAELAVVAVRLVNGADEVNARLPWIRRLGIPLVVLSGNGEAEDFACAAFRDGVRGWVTTDSPIQHLCTVIHGVLRDETWIPPTLLTRVLSELMSIRDELDAEAMRLATLTAREREVLACLCAGLTRPMIAKKLFLSPFTVRTHIQNGLVKLGVHSSLAAVALAQRVGLPVSSARRRR